MAETEKCDLPRSDSAQNLKDPARTGSNDTLDDIDAPPTIEYKKAKEELAKQIESLTVPGYTVLEDGVFTIISRKRRLSFKTTYLMQIVRWLLRFKKWLPTLMRFIKDSFGLAPIRMCLLILSKQLNSVTPAIRLWATSRLLQIVEKAIATGHINKAKLCFFATISGLMGPGLRQLQFLFARNTSILERKYGAMIVSNILRAIAGLDWPSWSNPDNNKLIYEAANMARGSSSKAFRIVTDIVRLFTIAAGTVTQVAFVKRSLLNENGDLFAMGVVLNLLHTADWLLQGDTGSTWDVTNTDYQRMKHIWNYSITSPESVLLDIPQYFFKEFEKANARLGDVPTSRRAEWGGLAQAAKVLDSFSSPLLYALFALRAAARRGTSKTPSLLFQAVFSTSALYCMESATSALAGEVGSLFYVLEDVRSHCASVMRYYKCLDLKPQLKPPQQPKQYETQTVAGDAPQSGMHIEFKDVDFWYPNSDRPALSQVSFNINPGSLVCIVGYNGAGKSTLINLISRLVDPSSGTVLINGADAKDYAPRDLYSRISCQFQETYPLKCTIREWLHMGDVSDEDDAAKMEECLRLVGADKIIARFPRGLDARLGPYLADSTPQSLLKDFVEQDEELHSGDVSEQEGSMASGGAGEDDCGYVVGSMRLGNKDCSFSPGEWSKMCFARSLMKQNADLRIFDEPTAKMDPIASRAVFEKLQALRGSCAIVHITHDLSACLRADQVILFEEGTNVESGTHDSLLAQTDSRYCQFYMASLGGWEEDNEGQTLAEAQHGRSDLFDDSPVLQDSLLEQVEKGRGQLANLPSDRGRAGVTPAGDVDGDSGYDGSSASSCCSD